MKCCKCSKQSTVKTRSCEYFCEDCYKKAIGAYKFNKQYYEKNCWDICPPFIRKEYIDKMTKCALDVNEGIYSSPKKCYPCWKEFEGRV